MSEMKLKMEFTRLFCLDSLFSRLCDIYSFLYFSFYFYGVLYNTTPLVLINYIYLIISAIILSKNANASVSIGVSISMEY